MSIREVRIIETIIHTIEVETKKNWRYAEEIALDHLSMLQTEDEAAKTRKQIVTHKMDSEFSLSRMSEFGQAEDANKSDFRHGMRIV
jgi:hypothetical protein